MNSITHRLGVAVVIAAISCAFVLSCTQPEPDPTRIPTEAPTATSIPTVAATATATSEPTSTSVPTTRPTQSPEPTLTPIPTLPPPTAAPTISPTSTPIPPAPTATAEPTAKPTATAAPVTPTVAVPKPRPIEGKRGDKLRFSIPSAPPHQDIHESVSPILAAWGPGIAYSRLFRHQWNNQPPNIGADALADGFDPTALAFAGDILCDVCADWSMDDIDQLTVVLREDVNWQDVAPANGRRLVAQDVAFSLNRLRGPEFQNRDLLNSVSSVEATDDRTVVIQTSVPDAEIFEKLADAGAAIVSPEAVAAGGNLRTGPTVGTGPWILGRYELLLLTFSANLDYFIPVLPLTFSIEASVVPELSTRVVMIQVDSSDFVQLDINSLRSLIERNPETRWVAEFDPASGIEVAFNTTAPPLNDIRVRRAVLNSWDPQGLIDGIHGGMSFLSAGLPLRDPAWLLPQVEAASYFGDRELAAELLQAAGSPRRPIAIKVGEFGDAYTQTALRLANAFRTAGFLPTIQAVSTREFADEVWINGDYQVYLGAPPPQSSVTSMLFSVHHSTGPWNSNGFSSAELDAAIARQTTQFETVARRTELMEIQRFIFAGAHRFVAAANVSVWTWTPSVQNFSPNTFRGDSHWLSRIWKLE